MLIRYVAVALLLGSLAGCGSDEQTPSAATTPTPAPVATPTPTPTPLPTPVPTPVPGTACGVERQSVEVDCSREAAQFFGEVDAAIAKVIEERPDLFDLSQGTNGSIPVLQPGAYLRAVAAMVQNTHGLCALRAPEPRDEITVKFDNEFSENYDILLSDNRVRRGPATYRVTCRPAGF